MNPRMQRYLRREVSAAIEHMIRYQSLFQVFDVDDKGEFVFLMAIIPKTAVAQFEPYMKPCTDAMDSTATTSSTTATNPNLAAETGTKESPQ